MLLVLKCANRGSCGLWFFDVGGTRVSPLQLRTLSSSGCGGSVSPLHSDAPPSPPVNHVFVDFENLKTIDGDTLGRKNFTFHLILGPTNKTLPVDAVARMMENAQAVTLVRSPKSGKNAANFVLAYYLGQAAAADPKGYFHILSADEGFDSLAELLRSRKMKVKRHGTWAELKALIEPKPAVAPAVQVAPAVPAKVAAPAVKSGESAVLSSRAATVAGPAKKAMSGGTRVSPLHARLFVSRSREAAGEPEEVREEPAEEAGDAGKPCEELAGEERHRRAGRGGGRGTAESGEAEVR
jgi:PIN domain